MDIPLNLFNYITTMFYIFLPLKPNQNISFLRSDGILFGNSCPIARYTIYYSVSIPAYLFVLQIFFISDQVGFPLPSGEGMYNRLNSNNVRTPKYKLDTFTSYVLILCIIKMVTKTYGANLLVHQRNSIIRIYSYLAQVALPIYISKLLFIFYACLLTQLNLYVQLYNLSFFLKNVVMINHLQFKLGKTFYNFVESLTVNEYITNILYFIVASVKVRTFYFVYLHYRICVKPQSNSPILKAFKMSYIYVKSKANYLHKNIKHNKNYRIRLMFILTRRYHCREHSVSLSLVVPMFTYFSAYSLRERELTSHTDIIDHSYNFEVTSPKMEINKNIIFGTSYCCLYALIYLDSKIYRYLFSKSKIEFIKTGNIKHLTLLCHLSLRYVIFLHRLAINNIGISHQLLKFKLYIFDLCVEDSIWLRLCNRTNPAENSCISNWNLRYLYTVIHFNYDGS